MALASHEPPALSSQRSLYHGVIWNVEGWQRQEVRSDHLVPLRVGSVVIHYGKQVHYDEAKDEDCMLEIVGMGPATVTSAEDH